MSLSAARKVFCGYLPPLTQPKPAPCRPRSTSVCAVIIAPMLEQRIEQHFIDSADLKYQAAPLLSKPIADAVQALLACVKRSLASVAPCTVPWFALPLTSFALPLNG